MQALKWKRPYWGYAIARIHRLEGGGVCAPELKRIGGRDHQTPGGPVVATATPGAEQKLTISPGVILIINTDGPNGNYFTITAKHLMGDRYYVIDSESTDVFYSEALPSGVNITTAQALPATMSIDPAGLNKF